LKVNGEELLETRDDGGFLDIFKAFFQYIGQKEEVGNGDQHTKITVSAIHKFEIVICILILFL
jgi:hypothetical protein